jgi:hypothetical protein
MFCEERSLLAFQVTPGDIIKHNEATTPFRKLTDDELKHSVARDFHKIKIEAIFVFADSRDWAGDVQASTAFWTFMALTNSDNRSFWTFS